MAYAILISAALFVFIDYTGNIIEQALNAFLLAGIIPGTSIQVPWYVTLISAPVLLYCLYSLLTSLFEKDLQRKIANNRAVASKKTAKKNAVKHHLTQLQA